jgi:hypothetical protein
MLYEVLSQVKNVAQKRIDNLRGNLDADALLKTLDGAHEGSIEVLAKAIEPRGSRLGRNIAVDMIADWNATLKNEYKIKMFLLSQGLKEEEDIKTPTCLSDSIPGKR